MKTYILKLNYEIIEDDNGKRTKLPYSNHATAGFDSSFDPKKWATILSDTIIYTHAKIAIELYEIIKINGPKKIN